LQGLRREGNPTAEPAAPVRRSDVRDNDATERGAGQETATEREWDTHGRANAANQADARGLELASIELRA
jgi:hypothetical protein